MATLAPDPGGHVPFHPGISYEPALVVAAAADRRGMAGPCEGAARPGLRLVDGGPVRRSARDEEAQFRPRHGPGQAGDGEAKVHLLRRPRARSSVQPAGGFVVLVGTGLVDVGVGGRAKGLDGGRCFVGRLDHGKRDREREQRGDPPYRHFFCASRMLLNARSRELSRASARRGPSRPSYAARPASSRRAATLRPCTC